MANLPALPLRRVGALPTFRCTQKHSGQQIRHASLLKRPHRPYTFTQLITLSDGSTYTQRTTSPQPVFKSTRDTRNHPMWQPSMSSLRNVEEDEAGRLKAFREKFGRGWDVEGSGEEEGESAGLDGAKSEEESLIDLISGYANSDDPAMSWERSTRGGKDKGEQK